MSAGFLSDSFLHHVRSVFSGLINTMYYLLGPFSVGDIIVDEAGHYSRAVDLKLL